MLTRLEETIAALATPPGRGAIAVIRVSGPKAHGILGSNIRCRAGVTPGRMLRGEFHSAGGKFLDEVMFCRFDAPASYTGEDMLEIYSHGGPAGTGLLLREIFLAGARGAGPGEFTLRAVLNGKMDLVKAEAVNALVNALTAQAHRSAARGLSGAASEWFRGVFDGMLELQAALEAHIEFPDDGTDFKEADFLRRLRGLIAGIGERAERAGSLINAETGVRVVIAGRVNVGKSSLFNRFLGEERSIVTEVPGTTRDAVDRNIDLEGITFTLVDTAGVRKTGDRVELLGQERTGREILEADTLIYMADVETGVTDADRVVMAGFKGPVLLAVNKVDLDRGFRLENVPVGVKSFMVSARFGEGIDDLKRGLAEAGRGVLPADDETTVSSGVKLGLLLEVLSSLKSSEEALAARVGMDVAASELGRAVRRFGSILGVEPDAELYEKIFSTFCIGK